jgi:hypothetical protein
MILVQLDDERQVEVTIFGLIRAIKYIDQWKGKWHLRNVVSDKQKMNFAQFVDYQSDSLGAEVAVAKYFGKPIDLGNKNFKDEADVGDKLEVKHTPWKDGHLILTDRDRKTDIAILVTGKLPNYYLCGWIPINLARRPQQRRSDGSYWINQSDLHPIGDLIRSSHANKI